MTRLRHYDNLGTTRFITFSCHRRLKLINNDLIRQTIIDNIKSIILKYSIRIYGYVIMPEHVHLVIHPAENLKLGRIIGNLKGLTSRAILNHLRETNSDWLSHLQVKRDSANRTVFWQRRCFDHNCRTSSSTLEKIEYCHKNPVIRGLTKNPSGWKWSSYNWYMGEENVPLEMDEIPL